MRRNREMSILPPGMDGRPDGAFPGRDALLQEWQHNATETLGRKFERSLESQRIRPTIQTTLRAVTPETVERGEYVPDASDALTSEHASVQVSPRSIPGGEKPKDRRQGLVFQDDLEDTMGRAQALSPRAGLSGSLTMPTRPRTRTLDESARSRSPSNIPKGRQRIGSVHSTASSSYYEMEPRSAIEVQSSARMHSMLPPARPLQKSGSLKKKDGGKGRLLKRTSRPASPPNDVPSVDSLPHPIATDDANKILMLMKSLCGRMKGDVEYQAEDRGPWYPGRCYIDEAKGSLMYDGGDRGPFHLPVVENLRGCRVKPVESFERQAKCLEISSSSGGSEIRLLPSVEAEFDYWLAALLCWQQMRSNTSQVSSPRSASPRSWDRVAQGRTGMMRRDSLLNGSKDANIIKVGKLLLWDKGAPLSPSAIVRRPSTRDLYSSSRSWRKVSCILQDNGEFKLLTESDSMLLSVIQLSQLSRFAIQRLDKSVLSEEYCIAIFPQYTSTSTTLSIFRPVYIALESRVLFEVWFVLLRAFSMPEIYGPEPSENQDEYDVSVSVSPATNDMFRIEKSLSLRIIEAKFKRSAKSEASHVGKSSKIEPDPTVGDYFVEVMLDGEIRARTMTKQQTKNPFWREDCEFLDLPAYLPRLTVVLKRLDASEVITHGFLSSTSVHVTEQALETVCGTVDIPVDKLERGKDSESWWPIMDDNRETIGEMFLKVRQDELVVLLEKDYQPMSELLHRFNTGLTVQISHVVGQDLRRLAEILMNIFQVSGEAAEWIMSLVEDEIDGIGKETPVTRMRWSKRIGSNENISASDREQTVREMGKSLSGEANLLFRGNSLLTQALDFHMRRLGKEYLFDVLGPKILEINSTNPECEVDPSRLQHGEDLNRNWATLISLTTAVWDRIFASVSRCPPELRTLMKYICAVAEDRYGDFLRTAQYTSVSGFLFLRFFCPAILNPKLFGILPDHPPPKAQRALTLIAKSLQVLANLSTFGQKEEWMLPMNKFLSTHKQDVKSYIDEICSIPAERSKSALPASYTTPITILARLPPTSREGFPSLPYLIDHARSFSALVKLWLEVTSYLSPQTFQGELLEFNNMCISLQRRTDECLSKAEHGEIAVENLPYQWEEVVESTMSVSLETPSTLTSQHGEDIEPESATEQLNSPIWTEYTTTITAGRRSATGSRGSEVGRRERQSFWEQTFGKDVNAKERRPSEADLTGQSPPSRGQSRNSGKQRSFLSGLRRKGKGDSGVNLFSPHDQHHDRSGPQNWQNGPGGMI
ncbi:ras GAP protein-like protein [Coleophoma crateriformis]|uniref:Ras GAP protein-like protein n=1 Tax=Coleophoma crateriformis TaxID=565419 RepID=A0A3D8SYC8_9HELO|nr:ras GAP protein-like protein [Coleophoma crateriformis]